MRNKAAFFLLILFTAVVFIFGTINSLGAPNISKLSVVDVSSTPVVIPPGPIENPPVVPTDVPVPTNVPEPTIDAITENTILAGIGDPGDNCWLSTYRRYVRVNVRKTPSANSESPGKIKVDKVYAVLEVFQENDDIWYRIGTTDQDELALDKGWVAGTLNNASYNGTFTIVRGRCDNLINLNERLKDCPELIAQVRTLPPYIQLAYAASERPCDSFQRLLLRIGNDQNLENAVQDIETLFSKCPVTLARLYIKLVLGTIPDSFGCQNESTPEPPPAPTPVTPTPEPIEIALIPAPSDAFTPEAIGVFLLQQPDKPETAALYQINDKGSYFLSKTNDTLPKFYPVLNSDQTIVYYLTTQSDGRTALIRYDLTTEVIYTLFADRDGYDLMPVPFALTVDGKALLVVIRDANGTNVYKLANNLLDKKQDVSQAFLGGLGDIASVSLSPDNTFMAVERENPNRRIYVYDYNHSSQPPFVIGSAELLEEDCFSPAFASNSVSLYFVCAGNQLFVQRDIHIDKPDEIQLLFDNGGSFLAGSISQLAPLSYSSLALSDERLLLVRFPEAGQSLDYNNGQVTALIPLPEGWIATGIAWAEVSLE